MDRRHVQCLLAIAGLRHDIDVRQRLQQPADAGADQGVVVDDEYTHGRNQLLSRRRVMSR